MNRVLNKVALITGGGAGLGKASCELLASEGAKIVVTDIDLSAAEETRLAIIDSGGEAIAIAHDVACENDWDRVMKLALEHYGKLDVLVNNAGIGIRCEVSKTLIKNWRRVMSVNLEGTFLGVRSAINAMVNNEEAGSIINISSISGLSGDGDIAYSASKGGVRMVTKTAAIDCGRQGYNIRVNAIYPGLMETPMAKEINQGKGTQEGLKELQTPSKLPMGCFSWHLMNQLI